MLVERASSETDERVFYLLDTGGEVARTWEPAAASVQEVLTTVAHAMRATNSSATPREVT